MGEVHHVVDHLKLEYQGVFSARNMFRMFTKWYKESPYEKGGDYTSEQQTSHGKCIEHSYYPWKKHTDQIRFFMKLRILMYDLNKVDVMVNGKKETLDQGRVIIYLDGFVEDDYEARWSETPMLQFLRTMFRKFFYKRYSVFMERTMIDDCHYLYDLFERFFNMYNSFRPIKRMPHFYY